MKVMCDVLQYTCVARKKRMVTFAQNETFNIS